MSHEVIDIYEYCVILSYAFLENSKTRGLEMLYRTFLQILRVISTANTFEQYKVCQVFVAHSCNYVS